MKGEQEMVRRTEAGRVPCFQDDRKSLGDGGANTLKISRAPSYDLEQEQTETSSLAPTDSGICVIKI